MTQISPITPQMKVADLLEAYPELEAVLVDLAPAFKRLKDPVLRRTVAKLTTLETASGIAGISPRELVAALRQAAGQAGDESGGPTDARSAVSGVVEGPAPAWFDAGRVRETMDADLVLLGDEVPLTVVSQRARALLGGDILRVAASFEPFPLAEALLKQGYRIFTPKGESSAFELFVAAGDDASPTSGERGGG